MADLRSAFWTGSWREHPRDADPRSPGGWNFTERVAEFRSRHHTAGRPGAHAAGDARSVNHSERGPSG